MRFGVDVRANTPYPTHHGGLKANGECLEEESRVIPKWSDVETNNLDRLSKITIDT